MTSALSYDTSGFVSIADIIPDAILDIRYFSDYNFVGTRIDGYEQPLALLSREAAAALVEVADRLRSEGYRLKIYDAYRPQRSVDHFARWAVDISATKMRHFFYPDVDKRNLFSLGYICSQSSHTRGSTVDLTLVDANGEDVDMGTLFDFFGPESHPDHCGDPETGKYSGETNSLRNPITARQFANRMMLRNAMLSHGFAPFDSEWWHFTLRNEPYPNTYFNFPIKQLNK